MSPRRSIESATCALEAYTGIGGTSSAAMPSTQVMNLLADLCHYCAAHDLDFDALNRLASAHYYSETGSFR